MQFVKQITIPANTSRINQTSNDLKVSTGVIHRISIVFPAGCAGLAKVALFDGGHPIAPSTNGQYFSGDDRVVDFPEFYEITTGTRTITIKTYNLDDTHNHTIIVEIYILPKWVAAPYLVINKLIDGLLRLLT